DEVGELPLSTQARLLRVLETGEFIKVGSSQVEKSDVRVVAATNLNIAQAIERGKFREDLFYRLNSVPIRISPLRDRKEDIALLFRKFASDCAEKYMMPSITLTEDAREMLTNFRWPGNVRQLKNVTEQISVIEHERVITSEILQKYLPKADAALPVLASQSRDSDQKIFSSEREILYQVLFDMKKDINDLKNVVKTILEDAATSVPQDENPIFHSPAAPQDKTPVTLPLKYEELMPKKNHLAEVHDRSDFQEATEVEITNLSLEDAEKEMIALALEKHDGKRKLAASELGISERTLYRKIKEYNLEKL
ncbi:MAG TPA: sigma-54-dependent Fis family transcriptional regulator, partial [Porphyromonadaceae bacterium]|nr:sigma-54-dependent Fis family transcriptional regulator [Porphyromonadaceae bacterium]